MTTFDTCAAAASQALANHASAKQLAMNLPTITSEDVSNLRS
ncbi:MAG: hypothetical protein WCJ66_02315 [Verrucomicrobiota bacterium]